MADYVIRGGRAGYDRLALLARERWPDTRALMGLAGVASGMRCADIGCGGGAVTLEIARLVGPGGAVVGLDMDEVKIGLARQAAVGEGLANAEFVVLDVGDWDEPGGYDLVYSRFLLQHLRDPISLLRRLWAAVSDGGVLIVEDADFGGWYCDPEDEALEFFTDCYRQVLTSRGGDDTIGRRLYRHFLAAGIPAPEVRLVQPVYQGEGRLLAWSTLEATADAIIASKLATAEQVATALARLQLLADDKATLICGPRVFQLWSRRTES